MSEQAHPLPHLGLVDVFDGPGGVPTTVQIVPGGEIGTGQSGDHLELRASDDGTLNLSGGDIASSVTALKDSPVNIFVTGFNLPFGAIGALQGALTGTLADGTPLNVDFGRAFDSRRLYLDFESRLPSERLDDEGQGRITDCA